MPISSFIDGRWVGPQEAARLNAVKAQQAAYKQKWQSNINADIAAQQTAEQTKQQNYFKSMADAMKNLNSQPSVNLDTQIKPIDTTKIPPASTEKNPITVSENIALPKTGLESYSKEELDFIKKLFAAYKKNPNLYKGLVL